MSKKTIIIIISVIVTIGVIVGIIYLLKNKNTPTSVGVVDNQYTTFDPFGTGGDTGVNVVNNQINPDAKQTVKFYRITDFAIAGATFFQYIETVTAGGATGSSAPSTPSLRYVERANGHVYNMDLETKIKNKISNTTIPSIHDALFNKDANSLIYRYLSSDNKTINSFITSLGGASGGFLPTDILAITTSPDKSKFFYLIKNNIGVTGVSRVFGEQTKTEVFSSPFTEWLPQWATDSTIFFTTKASALVPGVMFSFDIKTKTMTKVLGGIEGLTTLASNDGLYVLYNSSVNGGPKLNIFNIKDHKTVVVNAYGLPEKCVWGKNNINIYCAIPNTISGSQYPDSWYQGLISFNDSFVKIDAINGGLSEIINSEDVTAVDATDLFLNDNEDQIFFTNKKDSTLWGLNLY